VVPMDRDEYEVFEHRPNGSLGWRGLAYGLRGAWWAVWMLAEEVGAECFATDCTGSTIVLARTPLLGAKCIFQVAYSTALAARAHLLRRDGYDVTSVSGNQIARFVLQARPRYDLFVVGHHAPQHVRNEMIGWLRVHYPNTRIVALNRRGEVIDGLHYNAPSEPPAAWLSMISAAVAVSGHSAPASARATS
jgi:hypothetical protein